MLARTILFLTIAATAVFARPAIADVHAVSSEVESQSTEPSLIKANVASGLTGANADANADGDDVNRPRVGTVDRSGSPVKGLAPSPVGTLSRIVSIPKDAARRVAAQSPTKDDPIDATDDTETATEGSPSTPLVDAHVLGSRQVGDVNALLANVVSTLEQLLDSLLGNGVGGGSGGGVGSGVGTGIGSGINLPRGLSVPNTPFGTVAAVLDRTPAKPAAVAPVTAADALSRVAHVKAGGN